MANMIDNKNSIQYSDHSCEEVNKLVQLFFSNDGDLVSLFNELVQLTSEEEGQWCFRIRQKIIGIGAINEKYLFYVSPSNYGFTVKFAGDEEICEFARKRKTYLVAKLNEALFFEKYHDSEMAVTTEQIDTVANKAPSEFFDYIESLLKAGNYNLDSSQLAFCDARSDANICLLAPAGSGKTYSILYRCLKILEASKNNADETKPNFLLITFTNAASSELNHRLKTHNIFSGIQATVKTLNSYGFELLRRTYTGLKVIESKKFEKSMIVSHNLAGVIDKHIYFKNAYNTARNKINFGAYLIDVIDQFKSMGFNHRMNVYDYNNQETYLQKIGLGSYLSSAYDLLYFACKDAIHSEEDKRNIKTSFFDFWKDAVLTMREQRYLTFEDQKYWCKEELLSRINNQNYSRNKFTHIIVDEFQDINPLDMEMISVISRYNGGKNHEIPLTIVGDDDQSIFGWRGTTPKYIVHPNDFLDRNFKTYILNNNYRSSKEIVTYSTNLISNNVDRVPKKVVSKSSAKTEIKVLNWETESIVFDKTLELAEELKNKGCKQVALIGRKQASIFPYQVLLSSENKDYFVAEDIDIFAGSLMESFENILEAVIFYRNNNNFGLIKDAGYKRYVVGQLVDYCILLIDSMGRFSLRKDDKVSLKNAIVSKNPDSFEDILNAIQSITDRDVVWGQSQQRTIELLKDTFEANSVKTFMDIVVNNYKGFQKNYEKVDDDNHYKSPQFYRLSLLSIRYGDDFEKFSRDIENAKKHSNDCRELDKDDSEYSYDKVHNNSINLITAIRSKGHEYDAVIMLNASDKEWLPKDTGDIEEDRRVFYVAMTRAKKYLYFVTSCEEPNCTFLRETLID
ncbi:MAG: ATP-dependent helicase [Clostridiales bacterium]|nr:ATP-dependent helicase [Clostridiales bacterium]